ncbi:MAG: hypothetical protein GX964_09825 [Syntrophomonadaceae bacterium]|jgi:uncharacterized protein YycO|nr:hypothetical protein [Syntrophomonadaceae bacterium]
MYRFFRYYPLVLTGVVIILAAAIMVANPGYLHSLPQSVTACYIGNFCQGNVGTGYFTGRGNQLDFDRLHPGDILLGGKPGGAYGHFTHAGLYLGDNQVLEGYVDCGISRQPVNHYHRYDWACILRVQIPEKNRQQALAYALGQEFKPFYPAAFKPGERLWNCTKLIWAAYQRQGVDLDSNDDLWITPDAMYHSAHVQIIDQRGEMP